MKLPQTEDSDTTRLEDSGWKYIQLNTSNIMVETPDVISDFIEMHELEVLPNEIILAPLTSRHNIDNWTHNALLKESMSVYKDIWSTLATK